MAESTFKYVDVKRIADAYEGMALARLARFEASGDREGVTRSRVNQDLMLAASNYVMSGNCWSMMDPAKALLMFRQPVMPGEISHVGTRRTGTNGCLGIDRG
jgi:hypothetical protein